MASTKHQTKIGGGLSSPLAVSPKLETLFKTPQISPRVVPAPALKKVKAVKTQAVKSTGQKRKLDALEEVATKTPARKVAKGPYNVDKQQGKPDPVDRPIIWSPGRQGLCETLPYYRNYQKGSYTNGGQVHGILLAAEVGIRDKFNAEVIITTTGGGRGQNEAGQTVYIKDQTENNDSKSFTKNMMDSLPVGVIATQGNQICPSRLPHYACVLGWFQVTDLWQEKRDGFNVWVTRLEKINLAEVSWWAAKTYSPQANLQHGLAITIPRTTCTTCHKESDAIFNLGWTCMNTSCEKHFDFGVTYDDRELDYSQDFLNKRTLFAGQNPGPLAPPRLTPAYFQVAGAVGYEVACKKGIHCPQCGCLSRRIQWDHWYCENAPCDFTYRLPVQPITAEQALRANRKPKKSDYEFHRDGITHENIRLGNHDVHCYGITGEKGADGAVPIIGNIYHFKADPVINARPDGPDELFQQMQQGNFGLKRNAARGSGSTQEILTAHWSSNWGAPYKFAVRQISKPFGQAPEAILKAVKRLTWAGSNAVGNHSQPFVDFNEMLSVGYFEEGHMGYHDDGERMLGPTVASLSLGCSAIMTFRAKSMYKAGPTKECSGFKKPSLRIVLDHGDMMVMHGTAIQALYEHEVVPLGKLRYALTSRYIDPDKIDEADREYSQSAGTFPAGFNYKYDGQ